MYYIHNINIKYIDPTNKYISFGSIHYAINLDVVSSFIVLILNDFDSSSIDVFINLSQ